VVAFRVLAAISLDDQTLLERNKIHNPRSKRNLGDETSKLRGDASEAVAKERSPRRSPWRGEFWQRLAAVSVPFDASPHPSAFGGHPLPQGEREESLFALPR